MTGAPKTPRSIAARAERTTWAPRITELGSRELHGYQGLQSWVKRVTRKTRTTKLRFKEPRITELRFFESHVLKKVRGARVPIFLPVTLFHASQTKSNVHIVTVSNVLRQIITNFF